MAFVDIETTGGYPGVHRVIDIAVIGATGDRLDFEWQTLVHPGVRVSAGITALTGIDDDMLADAPPFERVARELRERLAGRVFVAHNVRFDYGFIRREFARMGTEWRSPNLCTVRLSRALYPADAAPQSRRRHGAPWHHGASSAIAPCPTRRCCGSSGASCARPGQREQLQSALDLASLRVTLPAALSPDLPDDLPEGAGCVSLFRRGRAGAGTRRCCTSARPTTCVSACWITSAPVRGDCQVD